MTTTKAQERKALEQIRKIVESLGEDSYVGTAFEGCFADAEDNIENDFAMSMKGRWQEAENKVKQYKDIRDGLAEENKGLRDAYKEATERIESKNEALNSLQEDCNYWRDHCKEAQSNYYNEEARCDTLEAKIKEQEQQILELKAKLYDYMVKEAH